MEQWLKEIKGFSGNLQEVEYLKQGLY